MLKEYWKVLNQYPNSNMPKLKIRAIQYGGSNLSGQRKDFEKVILLARATLFNFMDLTLSCCLSSVLYFPIWSLPFTNGLIGVFLLTPTFSQ